MPAYNDGSPAGQPGQVTLNVSIFFGFLGVRHEGFSFFVSFYLTQYPFFFTSIDLSSATKKEKKKKEKAKSKKMKREPKKERNGDAPRVLFWAALAYGSRSRRATRAPLRARASYASRRRVGTTFSTRVHAPVCPPPGSRIPDGQLTIGAVRPMGPARPFRPMDPVEANGTSKAIGYESQVGGARDTAM